MITGKIMSEVRCEVRLLDPIEIGVKEISKVDPETLLGVAGRNVLKRATMRFCEMLGHTELPDPDEDDDCPPTLQIELEFYEMDDGGFCLTRSFAVSAIECGSPEELIARAPKMEVAIANRFSEMAWRLTGGEKEAES